MLTNNIFNKLKLNKLKRDFKTIFLVRNRILLVILSILNPFSSTSFSFSSNAYALSDYYTYKISNQTNQITTQECSIQQTILLKKP